MSSDSVETEEPKPFTEMQRDQFIESLYAVGNADGVLTEEERTEIENIALELGFPGQDETG